MTSAPTPQASGSRGVPAGLDVAGPDVAAGEPVLHCPTLRTEGARPQPFPRPEAARGRARNSEGRPGAEQQPRLPPPLVRGRAGQRGAELRGQPPSRVVLAGPSCDPSYAGHGRPSAPGPISGAGTDMQMRRRLLRECRSQGLVGSRWGSEPGQSGGCVARGGAAPLLASLLRSRPGADRGAWPRSR